MILNFSTDEILSRKTFKAEDEDKCCVKQEGPEFPSSTTLNMFQYNNPDYDHPFANLQHCHVPHYCQQNRQTFIKFLSTFFDNRHNRYFDECSVLQLDI